MTQTQVNLTTTVDPKRKLTIQIKERHHRMQRKNQLQMELMTMQKGLNYVKIFNW